MPAQRTESPKRINVAISPEMLAAIDHIIEQEEVSLTEAVRRLVGYGDYVYRAIRDQGAQVLVRTEQSTKEVVLL